MTKAHTPINMKSHNYTLKPKYLYRYLLERKICLYTSDKITATYEIKYTT